MVGAAVPDADHVAEAEMLRPQLQAERSVRGQDGIADAGGQGNAGLGMARAGAVSVEEHARSRGEECCRE
jgi:hypothetical protein